MEISTGAVAAGTLAVLWAFEALAPALRGPRAGLAQRARHIIIGLGNALVSSAIVTLLLLADTAAAASGIGALRLFEAPVWVTGVIAFCLLDLWHYTCHVLWHQVPLLWRFHAVHHNADSLEATAAMRFHTLEVAAQGLVTIPVVVVLGIGIEHVALYNLVLLPVSLFHHADIRLSPRADRMLRLVIVTPRMHWLHHSRWQPETNSNYASVLSIWDRLFRTMRSRLFAERVDVGLDGHGRREINTLGGMLAAPFEPSRSEFGERPPEAELEPDRPVVGGSRAARVERAPGEADWRGRGNATGGL